MRLDYWQIVGQKMLTNLDAGVTTGTVRQHKTEIEIGQIKGVTLVGVSSIRANE